MLALDRFKLPDKMRRKLLNGISRHGHRDQTKTKIKIRQLLGGKIYHPMFEGDDNWKDVRTWFENKLDMCKIMTSVNFASSGDLQEAIRQARQHQVQYWEASF